MIKRITLAIIACSLFMTGTAFGQQASLASSEQCLATADIDTYGALRIDIMDIQQFAFAGVESSAAGPNCAGDKMYLCDGSSGGSATVKKKSDCDKCASNHCDGCCDYFCSTAACKTRCCANECGTTC